MKSHFAGVNILQLGGQESGTVYIVATTTTTYYIGIVLYCSNLERYTFNIRKTRIEITCKTMLTGLIPGAWYYMTY